MKLIMNVKQLRTLAQAADFVASSRALEPVPASQVERYQWIEQTLRHFRYLHLSKADKGLVVVYLDRITGYSRQQLTRLIRRYRDAGHILWQYIRLMASAGVKPQSISHCWSKSMRCTPPFGARSQEAVWARMAPIRGYTLPSA